MGQLVEINSNTTLIEFLTFLPKKNPYTWHGQIGRNGEELLAGAAEYKNGKKKRIQCVPHLRWCLPTNEIVEIWRARLLIRG